MLKISLKHLVAKLKITMGTATLKILVLDLICCSDMKEKCISGAVGTN